jgi:hypothetical protein
MSWLRDQLEDAGRRGFSIKDDRDGDAVYVDSVRQSGSLIFMTIRATDSNDGSESVEFCMKLSRQQDILGLNTNPTPGDLQDLDETA